MATGTTISAKVDRNLGDSFWRLSLGGLFFDLSDIIFETAVLRATVSVGYRLISNIPHY